MSTSLRISVTAETGMRLEGPVVQNIETIRIFGDMFNLRRFALKLNRKKHVDCI